MSKEYIERGMAIAAITGWETDPTDEELELALNNVPAADVVDVKHGSWKYYKKQGIDCSFERKLDDDFGRAVSCPNCRADMRGE